MLAWACATFGLQAADKPNIVFVLADDLGWRDVGYHGARFFQTPNIDRLAREGMIFDQFYSGGPNCAPTRACLMTGMYTPRTGLYTPGGKSKGNPRYMRLLVPTRGSKAGADAFRSNNNFISPDHTSVAEVLKQADYVTARIGKWHLGPDTQGFDLSTSDGTDGPHHKHYGSPTVARTITDAAVAFIEKNKAKPFFLYVAHWDVHGPIRALKQVVAKYEKRKQGWSNTNGEKLNATYAAMIEAVDTSVARIRKKLQETGLDQKTLFIFSSDNGGTQVTTMDPLRGGKGALFEGGIRVSTCAAWPGVIQPGSRNATPLTSVDLLPTLAEIAGAPLPKNQPVDGVSFLPVMRGEKLPERPIFWHYPLYLSGKGSAIVKPVFGTDKMYWRAVPATVMRQGDWKLFLFYEDKNFELYNVKKDVGEKRNVAAEHPELLNEMKQKLLGWVRETGAPAPSTPNPAFDPHAKAAGKNKGRKKKSKSK